MFTLIKDSLRFKAKIIKYIWILWPGGFSDTCKLLAGCVEPFNNMRVLSGGRSISLETARSFGLSDAYWTPLLHLLLRIALIMNYSGMSQTVLYNVFMTRMDLLYKTLHSICTNNPPRKRFFLNTLTSF